MSVTRHGAGRRAVGGFTLVEVLASIAMIAVLLPVILYAASLASSAASVARSRTQAAALAQRKLDELLTVGPLTANSGDFGDRWPEYQWSAAVEPWNTPVVDGMTSTIEQLSVTVTWKQRGQPRSLALRTLVYQNASSTSSAGGLP